MSLVQSAVLEVLALPLGPFEPLMPLELFVLPGPLMPPEPPMPLDPLLVLAAIAADVENATATANIKS